MYFRNARAALPSKINHNMQSSQIVEDHIDRGGVKVRGGGRGGGKPSCLHSKQVVGLVVSHIVMNIIM